MNITVNAVNDVPVATGNTVIASEDDIEAALTRIFAQSSEGLDMEELMREGYRVLALADAETPEAPRRDVAPAQPEGLTFLGFVAMTDPPRDGVQGAILMRQNQPRHAGAPQALRRSRLENHHHW